MMMELCINISDALAHTWHIGTCLGTGSAPYLRPSVHENREGRSQGIGKGDTTEKRGCCSKCACRSPCASHVCAAPPRHQGKPPSLMHKHYLSQVCRTASICCSSLSLQSVMLAANAMHSHLMSHRALTSTDARMGRAHVHIASVSSNMV